MNVVKSKAQFKKLFIPRLQASQQHKVHMCLSVCLKLFFEK